MAQFNAALILLVGYFVFIDPEGWYLGNRIRIDRILISNQHHFHPVLSPDYGGWFWAAAQEDTPA